MREIPLSEFGLVTVADVCAARGWASKTVQNWIRAELLPVVVIGSGRSAKFLLRESDVKAFVPPARGRPAAKKPAAKKPAARKRAKK